MDLSIHGWPVIALEADPTLHCFAIPGVRQRELTVRTDIGPYLVSFAAEYHRRIAPLDIGIMDTWSWVEPRLGRASTKVSDHSAGVAIDLNATKEGAQDRSNFEAFWRQPATWAALHDLRAEYPLLEWGGDYETFYDPMHWTFKDAVTKEDVLHAIDSMKIRLD